MKNALAYNGKVYFTTVKIFTAKAPEKRDRQKWKRNDLTAAQKTMKIWCSHIG